MFRTLPALMALSMLTTACGAFGPNSATPARTVASIQETHEGLIHEIDEKLEHIHFYNVIGQEQLIQFDEDTNNLSIEKLYESPSYLKLQAVRSQVEEIEHEIIEVYEQLSSDKKNLSKQQKKLSVVIKLAKFSEKSRLHALSMENLAHHLGLQNEGIYTDSIQKFKKNKKLSRTDIEAEINTLKQNPQFGVFEKNVEHLSYMMDAKSEAADKRFYPSTTNAGNITGNEFPAKVWSLTYDDGPKASTSGKILNELKARGLKATFFQLTKQAKTFPTMAKDLRDQGMEMASHSYTHQQLTKVGAAALEKEITTAVKELSELHGRPIKFFRLPYGAGVSTSTIREKIASNGLIHVFWNIDTLDWMAQEPEKIVERTLSLMKKTSKDAGVILFHDIHERTTIASPKIMDYLKQDSRRVCTLDEIVTQMNEGAKTVCPQK